MSINVFQQKPAFDVTVQGSLPILHHRLALTGTTLAGYGATDGCRYVALTLDGWCPAGRVGSRAGQSFRSSSDPSIASPRIFCRTTSFRAMYFDPLPSASVAARAFVSAYSCMWVG